MLDTWFVVTRGTWKPNISAAPCRGNSHGSGDHGGPMCEEGSTQKPLRGSSLVSLTEDCQITQVTSPWAFLILAWNKCNDLKGSFHHKHCKVSLFLSYSSLGRQQEKYVKISRYRKTATHSTQTPSGTRNNETTTDGCGWWSDAGRSNQ